jgi:gas vesicle protein
MQERENSKGSLATQNDLVGYFIRAIPRLRPLFVISTFILVFIVPFTTDTTFKIAVLFSFLSNLLFLIFDLRTSLFANFTEVKDLFSAFGSANQRNDQELKEELSKTFDSINNLKTEINFFKKEIEFRDKTYDMISTAFADIKNEIKSNNIKVKKAEFIQHSSERVHPLILTLVEKGVDIELFLQDPDVAAKLCGDYFGERINLRVKKYPQELRDKNYRGNFKLYLYQSPASLNAIRLTTDAEERILLLGWYIYSHEDIQNSQTDITIAGGDNPCIRIYMSHPTFQNFDNLFENQTRKFKSKGGIKFQMINEEVV